MPLGCVDFLCYFSLGIALKSVKASNKDSREMGKSERRDLFPGALEMMVLRTLKTQPLHGMLSHSK